MDRLGVLAAALPDPVRAPVLALAARPGKCLRSRLLAASAGFGTADPARLAQLGALVELVHLASLLHDDVIDRSMVRRGAPAAHTVVGQEQAVLAGLACLSLVGMEAADLGADVSRAVSGTVAELSYGEMLDVERAYDTTLSMDDYLELVGRKTGALFRLSCLLGAAEAGLDRDRARMLTRFGLAAGVAFQILDDRLDLEGDGRGKPIGTDHVLGLFGAPTLYALRSDTSGELAGLLLAPSLDDRRLPEVRRLVIALGGLREAGRLARQWHGRAVSALDGLPDCPARASLISTVEGFWDGLG